MLIGGGIKTAQVRLRVEHREIVSGGCKTACRLWIVARVKGRAQGEVEGGQFLKAVVTVAQIDVTGIGLEAGIRAELGAVQVRGVRHIDGMEDERIHYAEDHCVCSDRECQGKDGGDGKSG